jgi:DNA ligase 1
LLQEYNLQTKDNMKLSRPLLAAKTTDADLQRVQYPVLASPKIDGIRAIVVNNELRSRSMKLIPNKAVQATFGDILLEGMDGELVVGNPYDKNLMQQTTSGVMTHEGNPRARYYVFDVWNHPGVYHERYKYLCSYHNLLGVDDVVLVQHDLINSYEELITYEAQRLEQGYEGVMIRSLSGRYKQNRSTVREGILLKVKRFVDSEARILSYEPLLRNTNAATLDERGYTKRSTHQDNKIADDLLGSLTVQDIHSGVMFTIGSGLTLAQRLQLWSERHTLRDKIIKYKSFPIGVKDKPRIPIFLGFRSPLDL